jgi:ATP-dependent DNA helicase DinG
VGYEAREGQLRMSEAVERALSGDRILLCEAGTGIGKTFAYLVPAVLSGRKVVISTATRALQDQIVLRDLPQVERALGTNAQAAVMKGLSNYVCLRRHGELARSAEALEPGRGRGLDVLREFVQTTQTGDVAELSELAEHDPILKHVGSSSETRIGSACPHYSECFVTRMKREAEAARIVIVNHHLFFADLALRGPHPGRVLPDYEAVIFDEAHQLEDIASGFFGIRVSRARIERMLGDAERALRLAELDDPLAGSQLVELARRSSDALFAELSQGVRAAEPRTVLEKGAFCGELEGRWHALDGALEGVSGLCRATAGRATRRTDALEQAARRAEQLRDELAAVVEGAPGHVSWLEAGERGPALSSTPVDLSFVLRERIFESVPAVVLTSATLAGSAANGAPGCFEFVRRRLGLDAPGITVDELLVLSPFDYERRALLYTPRDLPPPADPGFLSALCERVGELVQITGGGAFVLTTSLRSMRAIHRELSRSVPPARLFVQGAAPKNVLLDAFRAAGDAVLVATASFWEGVDVPGRALRMVVLEKLPFAVPTDPVLAARSAAIEEQGGNAFLELYLPLAAIALKQGFGRLIRSRDDAGIVALLDARVLSRGYGRQLLEALPPARRVEDLHEVREFWERMR